MMAAPGGCGVWQAMTRPSTTYDEYAAPTRAPLGAPPEYWVRAPAPGKTPTQDDQSQEAQRQNVFRAGQQQEAALPPPASNRSAGEGEFLRKAGVTDADANIRSQITEDATTVPESMRTFVDRLLAYPRPESAGPGGPVTPSGPPPTVERQKKVTFFGIF